MRTARVEVAVALACAVALALQVALVRVLTIAQWHHFAYLVISVAMLGFGVSGTVLALFRGRLAGRERAWAFVSAWGLTLSAPLCHGLSQQVPFETYQLTTQPVQLAWLLLLFVILSIPFFCASNVIALAFLAHPARIGRLYGVNMAGSGAGAAAAVLLMEAFPAHWLPYLLGAPACVAALLLAPRPLGRLFAVVAVVLALEPVLWLGITPPRMSEYKDLAYALQAPDAEVVAERHGPLAKLTAVESEQIRLTPGQIAGYPWEELGPIPRQIGLYFDGGGASPIGRFDGDLGAYRYLDYTTEALAYRLTDARRTLIIGAGGGVDVLGALAQGAEAVTAVDVNGDVFDLVRTDPTLRAHSGGVFDLPGVRTVTADGRAYLRSTRERYDLIQVSLLDSFAASAAGVYALNESYLYTVEAIREMLDRLEPGGAIAFTRWLKTPPRDMLKLFATLVAACEAEGIADPGRRIAFIRSWNTGTLVLTESPLSEEQIAAARAFREARGLDLCYLPGLAREEANRYTLLDSPVYFDFAAEALSGDREAAYANSLFALRPATDDRPYFFNFLRWRALPELTRMLGGDLLSFVEWGFVTLLATLAVSVVAGVVCILLPTATLARRPRARRAKIPVVIYFTALGLGFLFFEVAYIQRLLLFLGHPIHAISVVLAGMLLFAGVGAWQSSRLVGRPTRALLGIVFGLTAIAAGYEALPWLFRMGAGWPSPVRVGLSLALLAPPAFLLGMPFPIGLSVTAKRDSALLPWAWGINGCASVAAAPAATALAMGAGFRGLMITALACYFVSAYVLTSVNRR